MDKKPTFNYRKFYEKQTGKKVPKDFDIHHIDFNRENNDITNLVAIPKKLHLEYHRLYNEIVFFASCIVESNFFIPFTDSLVFYTRIAPLVCQCENPHYKIDNLQRIANNIADWANYRNFLLGKLDIPQILNDKMIY